MAKLCFFICLSIVMSINAKIVIKNDASPEMNDFSDDEEVSLENDIVKFQLLHSNSDDFDEYLVNRAEAHVEHLIETNNVKGIITYTLGARLPGDQLVAHSGHNQTWPSPQNVATTLSYPAQGVGAQVTYVAIQVNQSTNLGRAYILKGGLHQRSISIVVEAYSTFYLNYVAAIYGA